ncbi:MAG: hypothetical protein LUC89_04245 [Oscillospiraceae bacterium]|nr:hypothetical protein [Oscillospiraceae bacterium]
MSMVCEQLKESVGQIKMPEDMKARIIRSVEEKQKKRGRIVPVRRCVLTAAVAAALCLALSVPALAATVEPVYRLLYHVSPEAAQLFQPVRLSDEYDGIRLEVVSAQIQGDTAMVYVTLQDLTGDRVDETTDLFDSYDLNTPFDSVGCCELMGFDEKTKTASFLITMTNLAGEAMEGDKVTFSVRRFLSQKTVYEDVEIPAALSAVSQAESTKEITDHSGWGLHYTEGAVTVLCSDALTADFPVTGFKTGLGYIEGKLHIQLAVGNALEYDNHGYFYLVDGAGNIIEPEAGYSFFEEGDGGREDYYEFVFSVTPQKLTDCRLYGSFWITGLLTEGRWKVTFSLADA